MSLPEQGLKRLLHYGREIPLYQPGDRLNNELYHSSVLNTVENLIASEKASDISNIIVKAFSDGYSAHPSMLVYALAACVKLSQSQELKESAYKGVKTVCSSSENLFLFIKFAIKLSQNSSVWGSGFRKVCKEWYANKDAKILAEIVGRHKSQNGWSHKDIIKLIHFKSDTPAKSAVIKYILFGIKSAKKEFGENSECTEVLNYLQAVEDFKHMTDELQAARTIETHHYTLEHVPSHLLKSKEVWGALVGNLSLSVLLKNLQRIGYMGFLKPNSVLVNKVVDALNDENKIAESHLHPAQVFVCLRNYELSSKFLAMENAKRKQQAENGSEDSKKVIKSPPKPNTKIIAALYDFFSSTCKLFLAPTGLRYSIAIDLKSLVATDKCYRCPHVSPAQASVLTALCLLHADRNVKVHVGNEKENLVSVPLSNNMTIQQGIKKLEEAGMQRIKMSTLVEHNLTKKEKCDVFVFITDTFHKGINNVLSTLQKYRAEMNIPKAKFIIVFLKCHFEPVWIKEMKDPNLFVIGGFDENVPRLIEAFSRGAF